MWILQAIFGKFFLNQMERAMSSKANHRLVGVAWEMVKPMAK